MLEPQLCGCAVFVRALDRGPDWRALWLPTMGRSPALPRTSKTESPRKFASKPPLANLSNSGDLSSTSRDEKDEKKGGEDNDEKKDKSGKDNDNKDKKGHAIFTDPIVSNHP